MFTAPAKQPADTSPISSGSTASTAAPTVYVVVWAGADINHYAIATITLVPASTNPITFTGVEPTTIPAGGVLQDIFLNAHNLLNTTTITWTPPGPNQTPQVINSSNIFTIPITDELLPDERFRCVAGGDVRCVNHDARAIKFVTNREPGNGNDHGQ